MGFVVCECDCGCVVEFGVIGFGCLLVVWLCLRGLAIAYWLLVCVLWLFGYCLVDCCGGELFCIALVVLGILLRFRCGRCLVSGWICNMADCCVFVWLVCIVCCYYC